MFKPPFDTPFEGRGKVYVGSELLTLCRFRFISRQHFIDTQIEPGRFQPGIRELIGTIQCDIADPPLRTLMILHIDERNRLPFELMDRKGTIAPKGDIFFE